MSEETTKPEPKRRGKVVELPKPPKPINPDAVEMLKGLLAAAETGDVVEVVAVWAGPDGSTSNERTGIWSIAPLLGEMRLVSDEISQSAREEE